MWSERADVVQRGLVVNKATNEQITLLSVCHIFRTKADTAVMNYRVISFVVVYLSFFLHQK